MKNIYLLGASGSIGTQTLEVIENFKNEYNIVSLSVGKNIKKLEEILTKFHPEFVSVEKEEDANILKKKYANIIFSYGEQGLIDAACYQSKNNKNCEEYVINAVVGMIGLLPTIEAIKLKRNILLANKETLVVGGEVIQGLVKEYGVKLLPIDSEHSAIFQCLDKNNQGCTSKNEVSKIIITASGGAFRTKTRDELKYVTLEDALKHPNWNMGNKITIDCATMVNKGLEVIEAHYLFNLPYEQIETVLHKESIIHSMVEYIDGSVLAQMAEPNMKLPIQYALTYPNRKKSVVKKMDFQKSYTMTFEPMDFNRYPCLKMAYEAGKMGGIMPTVFNASNEEAVHLFMERKISFLDIEKIINETLKESINILHPNIYQILEVDKITRNKIRLRYDVERK